MWCKVENELYSVHRYFFQHYSPHFSAKLSENEGQGLTDDNAIPLEGVTTTAFDLFLSIIYPALVLVLSLPTFPILNKFFSEFGKYAAITVAEWASILDLATEWKFESIRVLAIDKLALIASPVDRIVFGRKYQIPGWLTDAYQVICSRLDPLTVEEGMRLGIRDTVKISAIRQAYGTSKPRFPSTLLPGDLDKIISLSSKSECEHAFGILLREKERDRECIMRPNSSAEEGDVMQLPDKVGSDVGADGWSGAGEEQNGDDVEERAKDPIPSRDAKKKKKGYKVALAKAQEEKKAKEAERLKQAERQEREQMERIVFFY